MRTVKIGAEEYKQMKALAKQRGQFLQYVLNDAIRRYLEDKMPFRDWPKWSSSNATYKRSR